MIREAKFINLDCTSFNGKCEHTAEYAVRDGVVYDRLGVKLEYLVLVQRGPDNEPVAKVHLHFKGQELLHITDEPLEQFEYMGVASGLHHHATWACLLEAPAE